MGAEDPASEDRRHMSLNAHRTIGFRIARDWRSARRGPLAPLPSPPLQRSAVTSEGTTVAPSRCRNLQGGREVRSVN
ncbi:hypothetical protein BN381_220039 [Candidatus Microthrix parvicella RN1]|uniref:Uncharacterized protein n=1 Tax=Candidatus Neomicrothrix parvicella RN1 TaxID=1229780 RepID=R4YYP2_9ACTN|nr:hypothetical protein BN381_220039 [Candidatus Microthrix parvicella RN1]